MTKDVKEKVLEVWTCKECFFKEMPTDNDLTLSQIFGEESLIRMHCKEYKHTPVKLVSEKLTTNHVIEKVNQDCGNEIIKAFGIESLPSTIRDIRGVIIYCLGKERSRIRKNVVVRLNQDHKSNKLFIRDIVQSLAGTDLPELPKASKRKVIELEAVNKYIEEKLKEGFG